VVDVVSLFPDPESRARTEDEEKVDMSALLGRRQRFMTGSDNGVIREWFASIWNFLHEY